VLVLSRKKNEAVIVTVPPSPEPQRIEMVIVEIRGDKVRIGWTADTSIAVHRGEVQRAIERESELRNQDGRQEVAEGAGS
jgi:carbon storage regulator